MIYCIKCGSTTKKLIHHHEKYLEIHGYDKVIMMCRSCHERLHNRHRREGICNIPVEELCNLSKVANNRRPGSKEYQKQYKKQNTSMIGFDETMMHNTRLCEDIHYNCVTGRIAISSFFQGNNRKKLFYIDIED